MMALIWLTLFDTWLTAILLEICSQPLSYRGISWERKGRKETFCFIKTYPAIAKMKATTTMAEILDERKKVDPKMDAFTIAIPEKMYQKTIIAALESGKK